MSDSETKSKDGNEAGRIIGIFWEPKPVFQTLAARPRWWAPLILLTVLSVTYVAAFSRIVGWESFLRQQIQSNTRTQQLPLEQQEQIIQQQAKFAATFGYVGAAAGVTLSTMLVAAVLLGVFNLAGGADLRYKQAFSITCYSFLPTGLATLMAFITLLLKEPGDFDLQNPHVLHLGAILNPDTTPKWLHSMATSVDAFSIWVILLLALGFSVASRTLRYSKSLILILIPWVVYVGLKSAWTALAG